MPTLYWRLADDEPKFGQKVHCFTSFEIFKRDVRNMRRSGVPVDPVGTPMRFWEIRGEFIEADGDDAIVRVVSARQIRV